jgi:L-aminopeptidase/D-esterase-like protein
MADHPEVGVRLPGGVSVGHWTDAAGRTGCTVVLVPGGAVPGVDVRGGAPGTLGTDELRPGMVAERAHAILLTGGSAFGLAAADGVMRYLDEHGVGFAIGTARVPIVAGAVIFDLLTGDPRARPDAAAGANTTIGVVVTDAALTKEQANRVAAVAHDGIARAVRPAHTRYDGDTIFCLATGTVASSGTAPVPVLADLVEVAAADAVARAIVQAVREGGRGNRGA